MGCCEERASNPSKSELPLKPVAGYAPPTIGPEAVFILGGPGSGKGTQCALMAESGKWVHLSTGDLLREERKSGSADAELIQNYITEGKLVPSEMLVNLLRKAMLAKGWNTKKFLIDGYPRNDENIRVWESLMSDVKVKCLLFLECKEETLKERILSRNEGRSDDNMESMLKRLKVFQDETLPVLKKYWENGGRVATISGENTRDEVRKQILTELGED